jgi:hypothetical protein
MQVSTLVGLSIAMICQNQTDVVATGLVQHWTHLSGMITVAIDAGNSRWAVV